MRVRRCRSALTWTIALLATTLAGCGTGPGSTSEPSAGPVSGPVSGPGRSTTRPTAPAPASPSPRETPTTNGPQPSPESVFSGRTIGIDPGHNGLNHTRPDLINAPVPSGRGNVMKACNTTGTETNDGYPESAYNFAVAQFLARDLRSRGATVVITRTSNAGVGPCVDERARIINRARADIAIDIHADGSSASARGFAVLMPVNSGTNDAVVAASRRYAELVRDEFAKTAMPVSNYLGQNGLTERTDLAGLNLTTVPTVLIESGNMRNSADAALLKSPVFQRSAAAALRRAMASYLRSVH